MITPVKNRQYVSDESEDEDDEEKRTLFCANLDERVTDDLLYEVFLQAGPIESARIPKDSSGRQRSFGFITYVHACTIPYAMQLFQGLSLFRKTLTIKFQGNTNTNRSPMGHNISPGYNHKRSSYDNSSLRGSNYMSYNDAPPLNPFKMNYSPDFPLSSMMPQQNISKHATSQKRAHSNASPYNRNSSGNDDRQRERERDRDRDRDRNRDRDRERDHDRRRNYNNGSNRHSDQRSGGKSRR